MSKGIKEVKRVLNAGLHYHTTRLGLAGQGGGGLRGAKAIGKVEPSVTNRTYGDFRGLHCNNGITALIIRRSTVSVICLLGFRPHKASKRLFDSRFNLRPFRRDGIRFVFAFHSHRHPRSMRSPHIRQPSSPPRITNFMPRSFTHNSPTEDSSVATLF